MRALDDWLTAYMAFTEESEPPVLYREWTAMFTIASALKRKVYLPQGLRKPIYPNLYVVLVGHPGRCRKGTAMQTAKDLIETVGISVAPSSITIEALFNEIQDAGIDGVDEYGNPIFHSSLSIMSEELMVFLDYNNGKFLSSLTDLYDCADHWEYKTKNMGSNEIIGVWLNLLGATTPHLIQTALPPDSIGGGLASRMVFVYETNRAKKVGLRTTLTPKEQALKTKLVEDLRDIHLMRGRYTLSTEAEKWFDDWYMSLDNTLPSLPPSFEGYINRRPTHLQKAAMILSASRGSTRKIEVGDFERALDLHKRTEVKMGRTFAGVGVSRLSGVIEKMKHYIAQEKILPLTQLHIEFGADFDGNRQFAEQVEALVAQGFCKLIRSPGKPSIIEYLTTNRQHEMYGG